MSRQRPNRAAKAQPSKPERQRYETHRQRRAREDLERLKAGSGAGLLGQIAGRLQDKLPNVAFIRRGYEDDIVWNLQEFYARRPRPWRPASCAPKINRKTLPRRLGRKAMQRRQEPRA
jgi:hypothetical protein